MKPLFVLLVSTLVAFLITGSFSHNWNLSQAGRIGMSCMLVFTSIGHFAFTKGMSQMLSPKIPYRRLIVLLTGFAELIAVVGLLVPALRHQVGWWLIAFFLLVLPANIYGALHRINYQKGDHSGGGPTYLWFRVPLQILFILWVYWSCIRFPG